MSPDVFTDLLSGGFIFETTNIILASLYSILVIFFMIVLARTGTITILAGFFTTFIEGMARFVHDLTVLIFAIATNPEQAATYAEAVPPEYKPITWTDYIINIGKMMFSGLKKLITDIVDFAVNALWVFIDDAIETLKKALLIIAGAIGGVKDLIIQKVKDILSWIGDIPRKVWDYVTWWD